MNNPTKPRGRPPCAANERKVMFAVRIPPWLKNWIMSQPGSQSVIIEDALIARHNLTKPKGETK